MRLVTRATLVFFLLLPALASAQQGPLLAVTGQKAPVVAPTGPALEAPIAAPAPEPWACSNRFAFNLSFGFGSVGMGSLHELSGEIFRLLGGSDAPSSGMQINAEVALRYYFPYHVLAQVGYDSVYNWASSKIGLTTIKNWNLAMEVPILVGGYHTFINRLYVYGAIGPSVFFFPRSWWDADPYGGISDFKADTGVGLHVLTGADFMLSEFFAVGLELRYRYLKTGEIKELNSGIEISKMQFQTTSGVVSLPETHLDFSGISLGLILRFYVI